MSQCECGCKYVYEPTDTRDVRIVILQRGWVFVGVFNQIDSSRCELTHGFNIRLWGTTKGLGELVNGPLKETKLDPVPTVEFHPLTVIASLKVNASAWKLK